MRITFEFIWFAIEGKRKKGSHYERHIECVTKAELVIHTST